jgi:predicted nucleic acid-binding protein
MMVLVDTNVLVRLANRADSQRTLALTALEALHQGSYSLVLVPQVFYEFWVVASRPTSQNGLGLSAAKVAADADEFLHDYQLLDDDSAVFETWRQLVTTREVLGKPAHDARLVAAMLRHGVTHLLTFNAQDFARFAEITVIAPEAATKLPPASA